MKNARILIVEDEAVVAKDIENSLTNMGFSVSGTAFSGEKAILNVQENRPDLVLMDIKLKGHMNGIEAARKIRARFNVPVIYLTAHADDETIQNVRLTQPFGYIVKPFEERELGRSIDIALYRHDMEMKAKWESEVNKALSGLYKPLTSSTASINEISNTVLDVAGTLTRSAHGYVSTIDPHTGDIVVFTLSEMMKNFRRIPPEAEKAIFHRGEDGLYPGLRGHALNAGEAFFTNNPEDRQACKGIPVNHLKLRRFLSVPVMLGKKLAGQIALANKTVDYTEDDLNAVVRVAEFFALAIQKRRANEALQEAHDKLEERVRARTADLVESNANLRKEIDTRLMVERSLRDNQEILRAFLDAIPEPVFLMEVSGSVVIANKAFSEKIGKDEKEIIGSDIAEVLPCEMMETRAAHADEVLVTKKPRVFESAYGPEVLRHYIYPVLDSRGEVTHLANLCFDVTMQKQMERQLVQSGKLAAIGFLVAGVAHEINNPNNFIIFNIPILRDYLNELAPIVDGYVENHPDFEPFGMAYPEFREDLLKVLDNIEHGAQRINSTVSELRDFSRKKKKIAHIPVDIKNVIEKAVSISRSNVKKMVKTLRLNVPENMPWIHTDPETIEHILVNLLINAAQTSDKEDSWVEINVKPGEARDVRLFIEVKDNGCGMDDETVSKAFDPFFTTKPRGEGTGLGLALCQNLAAALGGRLEVVSNPGKGSAFRLLLTGNEPTALPGIWPGSRAPRHTGAGNELLYSGR